MQLDSYKGIKQAALSIAYDCGKINRLEPEEEFLKHVNDLIYSYPYDALLIIDKWLQGLSDNDLETYCNGEFSDMLKIKQSAPAGTCELMNSIFDL